MSPVKTLLPFQPVTAGGETASRDMLEIMQGITRALMQAQADMAVMQAKMEAIAAVAAPSGGVMIDVQARAAITAIKAAAS